MIMIKEAVTREYLDQLKCNGEMFDTIEEMAEVNFPKTESTLKFKQLIQNPKL